MDCFADGTLMVKEPSLWLVDLAASVAWPTVPVMMTACFLRATFFLSSSATRDFLNAAIANWCDVPHTHSHRCHWSRYRMHRLLLAWYNKAIFVLKRKHGRDSLIKIKCQAISLSVSWNPKIWLFLKPHNMTFLQFTWKSIHNFFIFEDISFCLHGVDAWWPQTW